MDSSLQDLLRGIAAAPPSQDPDAWLELIPFTPTTPQPFALRRRLAALRRQKPRDIPPAERLDRLRERLAAAGVDGFLLPRTDEFNNEYLPGAAERMAWLTGFTGSAGTTVVLRDRAAVFVDGRYTVQVTQEVDAGRFEIRHLMDHPPGRWIVENLPEGGALGYDPMLTRVGERERLAKQLEPRGGRLVALDANPIDAIWTGRPAAPIAPLRAWDDKYAGENAGAKRQRMAAAVAAKGASALVLTAPDSIAWLLNLRGGDIPFNPLCLAFAILDEDGTCRLFVDPRKVPPGLRLDNAVRLEPQTAFLPALDGLGAARSRVLVDASATQAGFIDRLRTAGAQVVEGDDPCVLAKARKNPVEIEGAVAAQRRDGAAMVRFLAWLDQQPLDGSLTELGAAARLEAERAKDPLYRGPSFTTISAHGPNSALPHYHPRPESDRPLTGGSLYLVDSGGQYLDATTDITRTMPLGRPSDTMRHRFTLVLQGHIAIDRAVFPVGTTGAQLDTLARAALWRAGLDFDHGTGHGVGAYLCVHEGPARISKAGTGAALQPGMILSNEPGYYRAGEWGIRTENLLVVRPEPAPEGAERELLGFHALTLCPIDHRLIDAAMLSPAERQWVDAYHARVEHELAPLVGEARGWLTRMCAPLGT